MKIYKVIENKNNKLALNEKTKILMKIKLSFILVSINMMLSAQETSDSIREKSSFIHDISGLPTIGFASLPFSNGADFQKLAPNSILLTKDLSNYSKVPSLNNDMNMGPYSGPVQNNIYASITLMAGLKFKKMENSSLRIGIGYVSGENLSSNYLLETTSNYDTLTSIKTGQKMYAQAKNVDEYALKSTYEQLRLDVSYLLKAKLGKRFSFHSGIGATAGISFNNVTEIEHTNHIIYDGYKENTFITGTEAFQNKNAGAYSAYIPLGLNLRLGGNRCEFFKRMSIFAESRPTVNIINIPELKTYTFVSLQNGIGLRVKF